LLLIPLGKSILYVEPVFLQAEAGGLPELKRVIVVAGEQIIMQPTLMESIQAVFGAEATLPEPVPEPPAPADPAEPEKPVEPAEPETPLDGEIANLVAEARQHYEKAQENIKAGDWAGFGSEWDAMEEVLQRLAELTAGE
ncbi:MAG: hypothetical protein KAS25_03825, partial [Dehalococcoidales bacterium]|nr:hypothetical protein [Dehalococcoidales bacterium]